LEHKYCLNPCHDQDKASLLARSKKVLFLHEFALGNRRLFIPRFAGLYQTLPPEAQRILVESHLIPLLDAVPKPRARRVLKECTRLQSSYTSIPALDLPAKKRELESLLDELARDAKLAFIKDRSNRQELLEEVVSSLTDWLNDVWSVVFEFRTGFMLAHECLLFVTTTLRRIGNAPGGLVSPIPSGSHLTF
jgi:hypothetical protein